MGIDRGRQRARMPGEPLGEVEVTRGPTGAVDFRERGEDSVEAGSDNTN